MAKYKVLVNNVPSHLYLFWELAKLQGALTQYGLFICNTFRSLHGGRIDEPDSSVIWKNYVKMSYLQVRVHASRLSLAIQIFSISQLFKEILTKKR